MAIKILFTCGGTAGHINPALALADAFRRYMPDAEILFVGSGRRMENKLIPDAGYELKNIRGSGLERSLKPGSILRNLKTVGGLAAARSQAAGILRRFLPDIAVGTGGYGCYPVLRTAARMGVTTAIHESNAVPGLTTKLLSGIADRVFVAFPDAVEQYKKNGKALFTGTPVRGDFLRWDKDAARLRLGVDGRPLVVSFWGSLGAEHMNEIAGDFIRFNLDSRLFNHIHATGGSPDVTAAMKKKLSGHASGFALPRWVDIRTYIDDMPAVMAAADLVLCRAGASTVAELAFTGRPAVFVPSPFVTNNHQEKNALRLKKAGGALMLREQDCTGETLYKTVEELLRDRARLAQMADAMKNTGVRDAADKIVSILLGSCRLRE
jgi:UDP-N-acetylglucosamine--N-acetylmuramyl-(pentapeptide) pyrophosphoryl-undecaprenol N-acetylglucosamine transferase